VGGAIILLLFRCDYRNGAKFEREKWLSNSIDRTDDCVRGAMVSDLERRYLRRGAPRASIEELLGSDDSSLAMGNACREYLIGMCSGFQMDVDGLIVCYDADGKLSESHTVQH
jgi:hypothetical protein